MKVQHLKYALEVARLGSISKAADSLLFSQPNISSALKTLEAELGFSIFYRTNKGVAVTPKGELFLSSARKIVAEYDNIASISEGKKHYRFHLSSGYHFAAEDAFARFCAEFPTDTVLSFSLINTSFDQIIDNVYQNKSDLGVIVVPDFSQDSFSSMCEKKSLRATKIRTLSNFLYLREGHPLLDESPFDFAKLREFPFIDYPLNVISVGAEPIMPDIFDQNNRILVDDRNTRYRIVSLSNAFTIGCGLHRTMCERHHLRAIELADIVFVMYAVQRQDRDITSEIKRYLQLLKSECANITV